MMTFSQREWIEPQPFLQKDSMAEKLKIKLWNISVILLDSLCYEEFDGFWNEYYIHLKSDFLLKFANTFWLKINSISNTANVFQEQDLNIIFKDRNKIYDYIEIVFWCLNETNKIWFITNINLILTEENSAYHMSEDGLIIPIINKEELEAVNQAHKTPYSPVNKHIQKAISLFKKEPSDYANSIKESISAVEALCQIIIEDKSATLGKAIKKLKEKGVIIPPTLEEAFNKLYGYTSNAWGIRHALSEGDTPPTFDDAKYMLVTCSSFVNYLISKMN